MRITDSAQSAILEIFKRRNMPAGAWALEIKVLDDRSVGIGFTNNPTGQLHNFGNLIVQIDSKLVDDNLLVDFVERGNRKGLVFKNERA